MSRVRDPVSNRGGQNTCKYGKMKMFRCPAMRHEYL